MLSFGIRGQAGGAAERERLVDGTRREGAWLRRSASSWAKRRASRRRRREAGAEPESGAGETAVTLQVA
eukprot:5054382-Pleurochrysis_carterae.AAC.3